MHFNPAALIGLLALANAIPFEQSADIRKRDALAELDTPELSARSDAVLVNEDIWERDEGEVLSLEKRRGGGGGGGGGGRSGGGGGSSSSGSSSSSGGGRAGGGSSGTGSSGSSGGTRSSNSFTSSSPGFGSAGNRVFAGGAKTAYTAGRPTRSGIAPGLLIGAGAGAGLGLGLAAGAYAYGYYHYPYATGYPYRNRTTNRNETLPVECFCQQYNPCGCDDTGNTTTISEFLKDNKTGEIRSVNGTQTVVINGTLPNGTEESSTSSSDTSAANAIRDSFAQNGGFVAMGAIVFATVWGL